MKNRVFYNHYLDLKYDGINVLIIRSLVVIFLLFLNSCSENIQDKELPIYHSIGGDFSLPSTLGDKLTLSNYRGQVVLLNFGYTSCPDICPMVLSRLAGISKQLINQNGLKANAVQTIFISVDPERDTLEKLKEYLSFFHPDFVGISASLSETKALAKRYAVFYEKQIDAAMGYQMAHTDKIFLMDKKGRIRGLYDKDDTDEKLIKDVLSLVSTDT